MQFSENLHVCVALYLFVTTRLVYSDITQKTYAIVHHSMMSNNDTVIESKVVHSMMECTMVCTSNTECCTANYNGMTKNCEMDSKCCPEYEWKEEDYIMTIQKPPDNVVMCDANWKEFNGKCYYFDFSTKLTWDKAKISCQRFGSYFVKIESECENNWIKYILKAESDKDVWIGANDIQREGQWIWDADNTFVTYNYWKPGEPNNLYGEDCAQMRKVQEFRWNDAACSGQKYYICEK